jgi:four helix bundle protein
LTSSGLQRLKVWIEARDLSIEIYRSVIPALPVEEKWGLAVQLRRAAVSVAANIAEGYGRFYYQANIQFCYNARGSLEETISHLILIKDLVYAPVEIVDPIITKADALVILLNGYIAYLRKSKQGKCEAEEIGHEVKEEKAEYLVKNIEVDEVGFDDSQFSTLDSRI